MVTPGKQGPAKRPRPRATITTKTIATQTTPVIYGRGPRTEMKRIETGISHFATTSNTECTAIVQGRDVNERIGNRVKVLRIEGLIRSTTDKVLRVTLCSPKDNSTAPANTISSALDLDDFWVVKDWFLNAGTEVNNRGHMFNIKFPMGAVTQFGAPTAGTSDYRKNRFILRIVSEGTDTVIGYVRTWYIDP